MAKIIFFFGALASSQTVVRSQDACVDLDTCSTPLGDASKSAALLQVGNVVNKKARTKDLPITRATYEESRQAMPADTQLGELLARVESLEAVAQHASKNDAAWTQVPSDRALDAKAHDTALLDRAIDKSRSSSEVSTEREVETSRKGAMEHEINDGISEAFSKAVEDRVAERKALADKAAFDAAVEKAVDEKLAADGIFPVPSGEDRIGIAPLTPVSTREQALHSQLDYETEGVEQKRLQRYAVEPSRDKVLAERRDETIDSARNINAAEEVASDYDRHDTKTRNIEERAGEKAYSEDGKIDGDSTKFIGDDLSETYVSDHKKSHSGQTVEDRDEHDVHSQSSHPRKQPDTSTDNDSETENEHRSARKNHARDHEAEESFEQATLRQSTDFENDSETEDANYDAEEEKETGAKQMHWKSSKLGRGETVESEAERHIHAKEPPVEKRQLRGDVNEDNDPDDEYEDDNYDSRRAISKKANKEVAERKEILDFDDEDGANTAWNAVARRVKRQSDENDRYEKVDHKVEAHAKEHRKGPRKEFKKVDPKETNNDDFPYEMLMDVDFIVDPVPPADSAEDTHERTGRKSAGNRKSRESEKHVERERVSPKFKSRSNEEQHSDEFRSERNAQPAERIDDDDDDEAEEIIFDQQPKRRDQQRQMKKRRSPRGEDAREFDEELGDNED